MGKLILQQGYPLQLQSMKRTVMHSVSDDVKMNVREFVCQRIRTLQLTKLFQVAVITINKATTT